MSRMLMGVVADDITGANDIGIMFAKADYLTHVYTFDGTEATTVTSAQLAEPEIAILDTNSRLDSATIAYEKVFAATRALQAAGCRRFFNKTCSVFRGNIGVEFDAMLDALDESFAVVILGFPKNGRRTINGVHYVYGKRLEESEFRHDPIHPMTRSNLVEILAAQTERRVGLLSHEVVAQGEAVLRDRIEAMKAQVNYLILDVADQAALATIAAATVDCPVLCGSSALAEEMPAVWDRRPAPRPPTPLPARNGLGVLVVAGSLMPQTRTQIDHLRGKGLPTYRLDVPALFEPAARVAHISDAVAMITADLRSGDDVVFHSPNDPDEVATIRAMGEAQGLSRTEIGRLISTTLAEITAGAVAATGLNRLVIAGGETSAAVCDRLDVTGMQIWQEIQPGLPSCLSLTEPPLMLVLKSGSFGSPDFLAQAVAHVKKGVGSG